MDTSACMDSMRKFGRNFTKSACPNLRKKYGGKALM
jgi:hypothetical protein